jgi:choline dehydrogenase
MTKAGDPTSLEPESGREKSRAVPQPTRRDFARGLLGTGVLGFLGGSVSCAVPERDADLDATTTGLEDAVAVDYIVVGGGPGGGPVAARLARAGYTVALLEAGLDPGSVEVAALDPLADTFYSIPAFLAVSQEHPLISWDFYVKHYSDPARQALDSKLVPGKGILYPRGSALGGSAAHNALLFTYPHDEDFNAIARATGDHSWNSVNMRRYFERLERCEYLDRGAPGHGFAGYINTNVFDPRILDLAPVIKDIAGAGAVQPASATHGNPTLDVNHPLVAQGDTGAFRTPMHIATKVRVSVREYLNATQQLFPNRLFLITGALATRVVFNGRRAAGVEYMLGRNLYSADKNYDPATTGLTQRLRARREVIIAGGAFNTPQLLKLSGVGPAAELRKHGIPVVADLPGVGENLQDRYEISVVVDLKDDVDLYSRCTPLQAGDPCMTAYQTGQWTPPQAVPFFGPYANNSVYGTRIEKSNPDVPLPDLFMVGFAIPFHGYFPGFSFVPLGKSWTWLAIKCHNNNTAGQVLLRSTNPRDTPEINFHSFDEGNDLTGADLEALLSGIKKARGYLGHPEAAQHVLQEALPGPSVQTDDQLREYIKNQAWGHHASCTAKIGADNDPMAVLDSSFRVRGVQRLRVVDASVFPKLPGFFPVSTVLMIGEKAADAILADARGARVADVAASEEGTL